jgi:hypothetical protein
MSPAMPTGHLDTDYLILGAGAMGMASRTECCDVVIGGARLARFPSVVLARQQRGNIHVVSVTAVAAA